MESLMLLWAILYAKSGKCFVNVNNVRCFGRYLDLLILGRRTHGNIQICKKFFFYWIAMKIVIIYNHNLCNSHVHVPNSILVYESLIVKVN